MPYRRDQFQFQEFTGTLHLLAHQVFHLAPTPVEQKLDVYTQLKKQLLTEFPSEGVLLNPTTFRSGVIEAVKLLQEMHEAKETVFSSRQVPFEQISLSPNKQIASVTLIRPTLKLLHDYPDRNFPDTAREGLFVRENDIHLVLLDSQNRQINHRPANGIISAADPDQAKLVYSLAAWAINPARIRTNP